MTAFVPLIIFLILYLGSGAYFSFIGTDNPLHQVSPVICLLPALFFAVSRGTNKIQHNIDTVIKGMGDKNTLTMCLIFLFSGAFSAVTQSIGSADTVANLILNFLPARLLLPGVFLASAFISTAIGTSMGVVALMVPIAVNLAKSGAFGLEIGTATVVGGAVFGDNLSMISDTTIASVSSQEASAKDKLKMNSKVALIASIITLIYLAVASNSTKIISISNLDYYSIIKIIPYISLIIMGLLEVATLVTITINIIIAGVLGITFFDYAIIQFPHDVYDGFKKVNEIVIFALFIGGLSHIMYKQGQKALHKLIDESNITKTKAEFVIAGIASMFTTLVANNTIAILLSGGIAKRLAQKHSIAPHRSAYLLDVFACATKGILPYGSQLLLAGSIASVSPISLLTQVYYCFILAAVTIGEIIINSRKEKHCAAAT
ncbi:sodium:proton antiporter [Wolbachia endosymbiont of Carposina sasakii]|jgi:Na+/H+ antiporter NhaC|uniref:Na+/H+ antiporter NhaC family protein n=1 Tax=Wolbachia TaxID=953 RepID=UPI000023B9CC|nr:MULTISPECIES: Na+/H+ antiporter NhaC family protein [Wolbachia]MDU8941506.1 Na+/H+ antiporter NhaC family protein [Wolbachia endosymbiont of Drosophila malagassya]MDX5487546.1 sodium:proton antiporter [Wolbachia endosymbiont of Andrena praecox]MDX5498188.1 sodium:proton antiporter [Wolbachia endosymbiont of Lasioglossum nitidulum]MDX5508082.1 sodium:proton antiporter [Wolbachia endosymbiont of Hylaeus sinuatus]MDX5510358.1 sodium:proton antiporter [Wolbachia endosymbiont of Lasioglossum mor